MPASARYDVVVVGSGPAGATTARAAARRGLRVLLVDKKQELGAPIQCSGVLSAHTLEDTGVTPSDEFVASAIHGFAVYDAEGNVTTLDYRQLTARYAEAPLGYVVDRRRFDRYLATLAERDGAEVWMKTEALGHCPQGNGFTEVRLRRFGQPVAVLTRVIVGADGVQSQVGRWASLRTHFGLGELASCLQLIVDRVSTDGLAEIVTGHRWAPGGYAWIFPKGHGYAEIGLGIIRTMTDKDARWHLDQFMKYSFLAKRLKDCRVLEVQGGGVPLAAPLKRPYADHIILVGDAAHHVNPITGGGIYSAMQGGLIAGNFLGDLIANGQPPIAPELAVYQERWLDELGHGMRALHDVRANIFRQRDMVRRDHMLHQTMVGYVRPDSELREV